MRKRHTVGLAAVGVTVPERNWTGDDLIDQFVEPGKRNGNGGGTNLDSSEFRNRYVPLCALRNDAPNERRAERRGYAVALFR